MSTKNARTLGLRLDETDSGRLSQFEQETHIEGVSLARAALRAALDLYERQGSLRLPLRVVESDPHPAAHSRPVRYSQRNQAPLLNEEKASKTPKDSQLERMDEALGSKPGHR